MQWVLFVQVKFDRSKIEYKDTSAAVTTVKKDKATPGAIAGFKAQLPEALQEVCAEDGDEINLSGLGHSLALPAASSSGAAGARATGRRELVPAKGRGKARSDETPLDKLLGKTTCITAACCKVRKATLRDFNMLEEKTKKVCAAAKGLLNVQSELDMSEEDMVGGDTVMCWSEPVLLL